MWQKTDEPVLGCLIFWEIAPDSAGKPYRHCGFYVGNEQAVSNSELARTPQKHHYTFGETNGAPKRAIEAMYIHQKFL